MVGPDLPHVASRESLGAGILPNDTEAVRSAGPHVIVPGSKMPAFSMLPEEHVAAIANRMSRSGELHPARLPVTLQPIRTYFDCG